MIDGRLGLHIIMFDAQLCRLRVNLCFDAKIFKHTDAATLLFMVGE